MIHTVGPVWRGGGHNEENLLRSCYRGAMMLAAEHELRSIAFPAISCGVYGYPVADAVRASIEEIRSTLATIGQAFEVKLAAFSTDLFAALSDELDRQISAD